jgi:hypothetical protein
MLAKPISNSAHARAAVAGDPESLHANLTEAERVRTGALYGREPMAALEFSLEHSRECCLSIVDDATGVVGMFGIAPFPQWPGAGTIWLTPSERLLRDHKLIFLQQCPRWIAYMLERYEVAFNLVPEHDETEIRWLKWCGFEFIGTYEKYGPSLTPHWLFAKARDGEMRRRHERLFEEGPFAAPDPEAIAS